MSCRVRAKTRRRSIEGDGLRERLYAWRRKHDFSQSEAADLNANVARMGTRPGTTEGFRAKCNQPADPILTRLKLREELRVVRAGYPSSRMLERLNWSERIEPSEGEFQE